MTAAAPGEFDRLHPMKDALHLVMRLVLEDVKPDARVLVVGAGAGPELLYLAEAFAGWSFVALDIDEATLDRCRAAVADAGLDGRVDFHHGPVESLPEGAAFDVATTILVSHFLPDRSARRAFLDAIAARVRPGGALVSADLHLPPDLETSRAEREVWGRMLKYAGKTDDQVEAMLGAFGERLWLVPRTEQAELLKSVGFAQPRVFCQTLLIHGWVATRA